MSTYRGATACFTLALLAGCGGETTTENDEHPTIAASSLASAPTASAEPVATSQAKRTWPRGRPNPLAPPDPNASKRADLASTDELVASPEVRAIVNELATSAALPTQASGPAGRRSEEFDLVEKLVSEATDEQVENLLRHENLIVRTAVAIQVVRQRPHLMLALLPNLNDTGELGHVAGCTFQRQPARNYILFKMCFHGGPEASETLRAALDQGMGDQRLARCYDRWTTPK